MSSDQILRIFSKLCRPIYSVKLISLKLKVKQIYSFCNYFVNSPAHTGLIPPAKHILP